MMQQCPFWSRVAFAAMISAGLMTGLPAFPGPAVGPQYVTVRPTEPLATEPGGAPGVFTISRGGETNTALTIPFSLGGTASNGVDYAAMPLSVTLAPGQVSSNVSVTPIAEPSATGYKSIILSLRQHANDFFIGSLDRATVYIVYGYTNVPPSVEIVAPTNDESFLSLPNIEVAANASDSNGWVTTVEFFADGMEIGGVTNNFFLDDPWDPLVLRESHGSIVPVIPGLRVMRFQFVWTNVPPGKYSLTAVATDNAGLRTTSEAVTIEVTTNLPVPKVRIINPARGAEFPGMAPINLLAAAGEAGGVVNTVEFFDSGLSLGMVTNYLAAEPSTQFHLQFQWLPYYFRWTNAPAGSNRLTAVAIDNNGNRATSAPVSIHVSTNLFHHR
jgi:hypothetical protein